MHLGFNAFAPEAAYILVGVLDVSKERKII